MLREKKLKQSISKYYKLFWYTKLKYQEEAILAAFYNYYYHKSSFLEREMMLDKNKPTPGGSEVYIIHFDVGLGKTITSIIAALLIREYMEEIIDHMYKCTFETLELRLEKAESIYERQVERIMIKKLKVKFEEYTKKSKEQRIDIIARKSILKEFQIILKNIKNIHYMPSGRNILDYKGLTEDIVLLDAILGKESPSLRGHNPITIVDELGTDPIFFGEGKLNQQYRSCFPNRSIIGLTANPIIDSSIRSYKSSPRHLKTDKEIKKQLLESKLYSGKDFIYKLYKVKTSQMSDLISLDKKIREAGIQNTKNILSELKEEKDFLLNKMLSFTKLTKEADIQKAAEELIHIRENNKVQELLTKAQDKIRLYKEKYNDMNKSMGEYLHMNFLSLYHTAQLGYLAEKNTILILDDKFSQEAIKKIKEGLKEEEYKIVTPQGASSISGTGNILLWKRSEIARGLNLQHFDAIVFAYIDDIATEEIYQSIGRLDRIWIDSDKEIIFMSHTVGEDATKTIIDNIKSNSSSLSISKLEGMKSIDNKEIQTFRDFEKGTEENKLAEIDPEKILESISADKKEDKKRIKERVVFITKHKREFSKLIKTIDSQMKESLNLMNSFSRGVLEETSNEKYVDNMLSIFW